MSKRLYLVDVVGDGTEENEYRPAVADYSVSWTGSVEVDGTTGKPLLQWTLVIVNAADHAQLIGDPRIDPLPDFPLDGKVSAINTATKNAMLAAMTRRGISTASVNGTDGYRELIRLIGTLANPAFNENAFDVN